ncbi:MAG: accessory factor UbiK family protein [Gammaproteobacteria bacterium]|nr:accessory factor UbiK family protein [Gammaproteobacteria bacterium]MDH5799799.1 accessory factor UbiK family protein [Gammaproteobacteria bacterium]
MLDPKYLDELTQKLTGLLPQGLKETQADLEKNILSLLNSTFAKMNLVTREEFDVQTQVLARTRSKLEAMEKQLQDLERQLQQ